MSQEIARGDTVFRGYWARDVNGADVTGLTISDFSVSLRKKASTDTSYVTASETVTLTELDSTNLPGQYEFKFTPSEVAHYVLEVTPTYTDNVGDKFRADYDVVESIDLGLTQTLCTRAQVKSYLGGFGSDTTDDSLIDDIVSRVTRWIQSYCGRTFFQDSAVTEYLDPEGREVILLSETPVNSVTSVYETTDTPRVYDSTTLLTAGEDYLVDGPAVYRLGGRWPSGPRTVKVVYDAGYSSIPADLNWAAVRLAALWYRTREYVGIASQSIGDGSVVHTVPSGERAMTADIRRILDYYATRSGGLW